MGVFGCRGKRRGADGKVWLYLDPGVKVSFLRFFGLDHPTAKDYLTPK